jgi:hypothetical protein
VSSLAATPNLSATGSDKLQNNVRSWATFEVSTAVRISTSVFWDIMQCSWYTSTASIFRVKLCLNCAKFEEKGILRACKVWGKREESKHDKANRRRDRDTLSTISKKKLIITNLRGKCIDLHLKFRLIFYLRSYLNSLLDLRTLTSLISYTVSSYVITFQTSCTY